MLARKDEEMKEWPKDIEAEVTFLPTETGGRQGPAFTGYRPQFFYDGNDWDAVLEYPDVSQANPGDTVRTLLTFLNPQCHSGKIYKDMKFNIREGQRIVAEGKVTNILYLDESAKRMCEKDPDSMKWCER